MHAKTQLSALRILRFIPKERTLLSTYEYWFAAVGLSDTLASPVAVMLLSQGGWCDQKQRS